MKYCLKCNREATDFEFKCSLCGNILAVSDGEIPQLSEGLDKADEIKKSIVPDYFGMAIFVTIFISFIPGVVSLVYAAMARIYDDCEKLDRANECSGKSKKWIKIGFIVFVICLVVLASTKL